jgi:hypothetical protein
MKQNRKQKEKNQNKKKKNLSHLGRPEAAAPRIPSLGPSFFFFSRR